MHNAASRRRPSSCGAFIAPATAVAAVLSALVSMTGCHSASASSGFAASDTQKAAETRLGQDRPMTPLLPFDEGFHVAPLADAGAAD